MPSWTTGGFAGSAVLRHPLTTNDAVVNLDHRISAASLEHPGRWPRRPRQVHVNAGCCGLAAMRATSATHLASAGGKTADDAYLRDLAKGKHR